MTEETATPPAPLDHATLTDRLKDDLVTLDKELGEVDLLITQATAEAQRHETRRASGAEKLAGMPVDADPAARLEVATALVTLTRRAALMESQVEVLEGKRRALARFRDAVAVYLESVRGLDDASGADAATLLALADDAPMPPAVSRLVVGAQEDLRREIARAMHDGPAQSLTNIVLQAQIVERLVDKDPVSAAGEVRLLTSMVQQTLDATKSFIFDVRPMVLDDLGLVPTLRRTIRERGPRANVPIAFDTLGQDRRLPMDLESGLFRMLDEALAAYLAAAPDEAHVRLDWGEQQLDVIVGASRAVAEVATPSDSVPTPDEEGDKDLPPALAALLEERRAGERHAAEAAARAAIITLPVPVWRTIQARASSIGVSAELLADGAELHLVAPMPTTGAVAAGPAPTT